MGSDISVGVYVRNLTDALYNTGTANQIAGIFGYQSVIYGEPRTWGAELRVSF